MAKDIYLAGKINAGELSIGEFANELEQRGHTVLEKWWQLGKLPTPYMDHLETSSPAAQAMVDAAYISDIAVLFPGDNILGAAVEFGTAIASSKTNAEKQIIVVNPYEVRQSVFYAHPAVIAVQGIAQVRDMDWY